MRTLAAYEPADWPSAAAARDAHELERLGYRRNTDAPDLVRFVDPIDDDHKRPKDEDPRGLAVRRHPLAWLRDSPEVHEIADELLDGVVGDLGPEDRHLRSEAEWSLIMTWKAAEARRVERELRRSAPSGGSGGK